MSTPPVSPSPRRSRRVNLVFLFFVLVFFVPALIRFGVDWLWFQSLAYESIFAKQIVVRTLLGLGVGAAALAFLYANLRTAMRGIELTPRLVVSSSAGPFEFTRFVQRMARPLALGVAVLLGLGASGMWLDVLRFIHRTPFGTTDPVFGRDVSYYVFVLPVITDALRVATTVVTLTLVACILLYVLRRDITASGRRIAVERPARMHVALLIVAMLVLAALRVHFIRIPGILYSSTGPLSGASFADLHGTLPGLRILALATIVAAGLVFWGARGPRLARAVVLAVGIYVGVSVLAVSIYPSIINRLVVAPNELAKEAPQLAYHIAATRRAWGLDSVVTRDLSGEARLTEKDIASNRATIDNIRLWDRDPLLQTFGQLQEIRTYYDFLSVDDDRYTIDGQYRQVLLSPRELNTASLPTRTFINERLTFTHGMGLTLGPVDQVTSEGLPVLFIKDLPPASSVSINVTRPQIYFGEIADSWVFANTGQPEFDYPSGDENVYTAYEGTGGVEVGSFARRLLFATYFRSLKVLLSSDITNESRAIYYRNIRVRSQKALSFLFFDNDPYLVVDDAGRLRWILDGYTRTSRYPYAEPLSSGTNYMRNSVKVIIDAYDGSVTAYLADPADPLAQTFSKIFPGIFRPLDEMPSDLRAHLRYPETLFRVQSDMYATYHMDEPAMFYHQEDQWQKPVSSQEGGSRDPFLRHIVMRLPGEREAEFIFMVPFTPRGKDNLAAWMVARNDAEHYGKLVVYRLPKQSLVFGPTQIVNRINQDTEISRQISLWDQRGSEVIRGNLLVIPIEESLIYVQPIYLRAQGGRIPELKRVVIAYQNQVVMEETLEEGLSRLFGGVVARTTTAPEPEPTPPAGESGVGELVRRSSEIYQRAISAQRAGDWARYGEELSRLGEVLKQLEAATGQ